MVASLHSAAAYYRLVSGKDPTDFEQLDIQMPKGGTTTGGTSAIVIQYPNGQKYTMCIPCRSITGTNTKTPGYYIEFYYELGKYCWAYDHMPRALGVCKSLTGKTTPVFNDNGNRAFQF
jgi:hypothetical protein